MTESYLYLAEIMGVGVKVGVSTQPMRRLAAHARDASAYGRELGRTWVSELPHINARENEAAIKGASRREYLDRDFDDCLAQALELPKERAAEAGDVLDTPLNRFLISMFPAYGEHLREQSRG